MNARPGPSAWETLDDIQAQLKQLDEEERHGPRTDYNNNSNINVQHGRLHKPGRLKKGATTNNNNNQQTRLQNSTRQQGQGGPASGLAGYNNYPQPDNGLAPYEQHGSGGFRSPRHIPGNSSPQNSSRSPRSGGGGGQRSPGSDHDDDSPGSRSRSEYGYGQNNINNDQQLQYYRRKKGPHFKHKHQHCSVWEQKRTKSMQLRVNLSLAARTMGVPTLADKDSANTILGSQKTRAELQEALSRQRKRAEKIIPKDNRCVGLRKAATQAIFNKRERIKQLEAPEVVAQNLKHNPPPPAVYDREIMPKLTKAAAMRTGCNFQDLAISLFTLRWAIPPLRRDQPSTEPFTRVNMQLHKKNGNHWKFGVGNRWQQPATWQGVEAPNFLVSPGLVDPDKNRKYHLVGRKNEKAILSACSDDIGPGKYESKSIFDKSNSKIGYSDVVINSGVKYPDRPSTAELHGTMGHSKDRFAYPTVFNGSPVGPNYVPPGLVNTEKWKKYRIVGRREGAPALPTSTPNEVGPGSYKLPPVFGLAGLKSIERKMMRINSARAMGRGAGLKDCNGHDIINTSSSPRSARGEIGGLKELPY